MVTTEKNGVVQLKGLGLSEFPPDLRKLSGCLRGLDLSDNQIERVPPAAIKMFAQLTGLRLDGNRLVCLPDELCSLSRLESLSVRGNLLGELPSAFGRLSALRTLDLSGNRLRALPPQLCGLQSLEVVDLSRNQIREVPGYVGAMQMVELNLNQNWIAQISPLVARCPRLRVLRLERNWLELVTLPPGLLRDSRLCLLALGGNLFDVKELEEMDGYDGYLARCEAARGDVALMRSLLL